MSNWNVVLLGEHCAYCNTAIIGMLIFEGYTHRNVCAHTPNQPLRESVSLHEHEKSPDVSALHRSVFLLSKYSINLSAPRHPVSLLRTCGPVGPIRNVHSTGWHPVYLWPWDHLAMGNLQPQLSISSSGGSRLGAGDISLMLIWLHCYRLSLSLCFFLTLSLSVWCWDMIWWEEGGVERIDPASTAVSLARFFPFSSAWPSSQLSPLHLFLLLYLLLFLLSPVCNHNNASLRRPGNKPGPLFFLHTSPLAKTKPIKGWLNYSCCVLPTPGYNSVRLSVGEVWRDAGLGHKNYWGYSLILSLNPPSKPSRHYFIVLTEMKKKRWW